VTPLNASQPEDKEKNENPDKAEDQPPFEVVLMDDDTKEVDFNDPDLGKRDTEYDFQAKSYLDSKQIKIVKAYELRQNNQEGSTIQIEFNLRGSGMEYVTAANLYIFPENDPQLVDAVAHKIGISLDKIFMLKDHQLNSMQYKHPVPSPISVKTYLTQFCDLQGPIK
jgi:NADPH-ferrihemoprotein reductase